MAEQNISQDAMESILKDLSDADLLALLDTRHPDYWAIEKVATRCLDVYDGDREVLSTPEYFPQGASEDNKSYESRMAISEPIPITDRIINRISGAVFEPDPEHVVPDEMAGYIKNADKEGKPHSLAMLDVFAHALCAGSMTVFVDSTLTPERQDVVISKTDEDESGDRVILCTYDPRNVLNWEYDSNGLVWIHLRDTDSKQSSFFSEREVTELHLIITREFIFRFRISENLDEKKDDKNTRKVETLAPIVHGLDVCPVEQLIFARDKNKDIGAGKSYVDKSVRADIMAMRNDSYKDANLSIHGSPLLWRKFSDQEMTNILNAKSKAAAAAGTGQAGIDLNYDMLGSYVNLGTSAFHVMQGSDSAIGYSTLDTEPIKMLDESATKYRNMAAKLAGYDKSEVAGQVKQVTAQSGVSRAYEYEIEIAPELELLSMIMAMFDKRVLDLVAMKQGLADTVIDDIQAKYPQPRMIAPLNRLIEEYEFLKENNYPEGLLRDAKVVIAFRALITEGISQEKKIEYKKEIEAGKSAQVTLNKQFIDEELDEKEN